jgi:hypothetical protein
MLLDHMEGGVQESPEALRLGPAGFAGSRRGFSGHVFEHGQKVLLGVSPFFPRLTRH